MHSEIRNSLTTNAFFYLQPLPYHFLHLTGIWLSTRTLPPFQCFFIPLQPLATGYPRCSYNFDIFLFFLHRSSNFESHAMGSYRTHHTSLLLTATQYMIFPLSFWELEPMVHCNTTTLLLFLQFQYPHTVTYLFPHFYVFLSQGSFPSVY